ncbi:hypothetical protein EWM64_g1289 [Hericium alpestre]|uniref:Uncharacterized protein n=1 Tax=Hericium alpestre TaxID=135208 RepID=A0A4Z0A8R7_9AGAM|nr:hypothetical protein EWM64_g1289 [Hericium alpestre]
MAEPAQSSSVHLAAKYPEFDIYPAAYPHFDIYPSVGGSIEASRSTESVLHGLPVAYPSFMLYPPVYPYNLTDIYPSLQLEDTSKSLSVRLHGAYPFMEICAFNNFSVSNLALKLQIDPSVYPHIAPYPSTLFVGTSKDPPVYPYFELYPSLQGDESLSTGQPILLNVDLQYPLFVIYPAVYPHFDIYPSLPPTIENIYHSVEILLAPAYPLLTIYRHIYPTFEIYPGHISTGEYGPSTHDAHLIQPAYPQFDIFYPYFDIYRSGHAYMQVDSRQSLSVRAPALYPAIHLFTPRTHADLHREAMTGLSAPPSPTQIPRRVDRTHAELYEEVVTGLLLAPLSPREPVEQQVDKADNDASPHGHDAEPSDCQGDPEACFSNILYYACYTCSSWSLPFWHDHETRSSLT